MDDDIIDSIEYIKDNISNMTKEENCKIFEMLINKVPQSKLREKNTGTQVRFRDIPPVMITTIKIFIEKEIEKKKKKLEELTTIY